MISPDETEGVIAGVGLEPADFPLEETIGEGVRCTVEELVVTDPDRPTAFLWLEGDLAGIERALAADDTVDRVTRIVDHDRRQLYRMDWIDRTDLLFRLLVEEEGAILSADGSDDGWRLRLLSPTREGLSRTYDCCRENGIDLTIYTLYRVDEDREGQFDLTAEQEETLHRALERGYYDVPRTADMAELATEFGVSHQAVSERLRRAHGTLVENALQGRTENRDDVAADAPGPPSDSARSP